MPNPIIPQIPLYNHLFSMLGIIVLHHQTIKIDIDLNKPLQMRTRLKKEPVKEFLFHISNCKKLVELVVFYVIYVCSIFKEEFYYFNFVIICGIGKVLIRVWVLCEVLKGCSVVFYHL